MPWADCIRAHFAAKASLSLAPHGRDRVAGNHKMVRAVLESNIEFVEKALRERITVTQSARDTLARARADAVQAAVLANTQVDPQRVFRSERTSGASTWRAMLAWSLSSSSSRHSTHSVSRIAERLGPCRSGAMEERP